MKFLFVLVFGSNLCLYGNGKSPQIDEALAVLLIVNVILTKGCDLLGVKRPVTPSACLNDVALVELESYLTGNVLLSLVNKCGKSLSEGSEPLTVVQLKYKT